MGRQRQTRQARRAQERRTGQRRGQGRQGKGPNWSVLAAGGVVAIAVILLAVAVFKGSGSTTATGTGTSTPVVPTLPPGPTVAGIPCDPNGMNPGFHIHAYLAIYNHGKFVPIDGKSQLNSGTDIGHYYSHDCLFEMHTHPQDTANVIHIESAHPEHPTLAQWFTIMRTTLKPIGKPVPDINPPGIKREVWVDGKLYTGDPLKIRLFKHEQIVVELGAPFFKPAPYKFQGGL